ncbi:hypothetical protein SBF1_4320004 [Candidatus Desulfosporosinus infrequens]|uniref:Uncharacterized protein n=1 Tax=Candidatus Desulfosporosinus infrequens TaxID=2043169 RepID=A0A2U3LB11_9FIRM|nr:hypothetical protein SBF1_4320004 [Candidatus Desulfosporosinus infrequens]
MKYLKKLLFPGSLWSLPTRERGLKYPTRERGLKYEKQTKTRGNNPVAPYAGAWIEISLRKNLIKLRRWSLPTRERGLKSLLLQRTYQQGYGRSLRGSVD